MKKHSTVIPAFNPVIPAFNPVIPAKAGISSWSFGGICCIEDIFNRN